MGRLTSGAPAGELTASQSRLRSTPAPPPMGGQPGHRRARAPAAWLSIKTLSRWPLSLTLTGLRSPTSAPAGRDQPTSTPASAHAHRRPTPSSASLKRGRVAMGGRVHTDRRDAGPLARLRRSAELTPVEVPAGDDDASRDLSRAREEAIGARPAAQRRLKAFWRRPARRDPGRATGGPAPRRGLRAVGARELLRRDGCARPAAARLPGVGPAGD